MLGLAGIAVRFADTTIFKDVSFQVARGDRWGIVGRNGIGKTSLFEVIIGGLTPWEGVVTKVPGTRIAVMDQHRVFDPSDTVWDAAAGAYRELRRLELKLAEDAIAIGEAGDNVPAELLEQYGHDLERFEHEGGYEVTARVDAILDGLGFDPAEARIQLASTLSGGERGRIGLAAQLAANADLLLLDEPTNHLDIHGIEWLEGYLKSSGVTALIISHDRAFLDTVSDHILHLENRTAKAYTGNYTSFGEQRALARLSAERAFEKQAKTIAKEEEYIRRNKAGQLALQAKGRERRLSRVVRLTPPPSDASVMSVRFQANARGGDQVITTENLGVDIGDRTLLDGFSATVRRGDVVGLVGSNGTGKSTLVSVLLGYRPPNRGTAKVGDSIVVGHYRQDLGDVPRDKSLFDIIHDLRPTWSRGQVQDHLGRVGFSGDSVKRRPESLSGGELARIAMGILMLTNANLLVFDEPTNHLDVETIEALEDAIDEFDATVLLVSHDRTLLRQLTTRTWVLENERIEDFPGGFAEWEAAVTERKRAAARASSAAKAEVRDREKLARARSAEKEPKGPKPLTAARRALESAEARVNAAEADVARLTKALDDGGLYGSGDGARKSAELARSLDQAKRELEAALADWERCSEEVDRLGAG
ncbi:MAG: ABC-F family ATP-binding cassette domain-containing protein [Gemmatimonadetes bacterium]|nr:ABC-F family ATP-binding cassette domain-containing protein [Gemmatimonadota bacterium]